jgi:hypothetical protein
MRTVDGVLDAGLLAQPVERRKRHERDGAALRRAVDRAVVRPQELQRPAHEARDRLLPRTDDTMRGPRPTVELRVDGDAELNDTFDAFAVRKREHETPRRLVPLGTDPHHRAVALAGVQPAPLVAQPEAPVADHATGLKHDLLRMNEAERLNRCDGNAYDARRHALSLRGPSTSRMANGCATTVSHSLSLSRTRSGPGTLGGFL